jgi:hypothetical protein
VDGTTCSLESPSFNKAAVAKLKGMGFSSEQIKKLHLTCLLACNTAETYTEELKRSRESIDEFGSLFASEHNASQAESRSFAQLKEDESLAFAGRKDKEYQALTEHVARIHQVFSTGLTSIKEPRTAEPSTEEIELESSIIDSIIMSIAGMLPVSDVERNTGSITGSITGSTGADGSLVSGTDGE